MKNCWAEGVAQQVFRCLAIVAGLLMLTPGSAEADGAAVYRANCESCHQDGGSGVPGVFPPLQENLAELLELDGGRTHLINAVLFGMTGAVSIDGQTYDGEMPAWFSFSDEEVAAVLNHVISSFGAEAALSEQFELYEEAEIKSARGSGLSPELVHERRPELESVAASEEMELPPVEFSAEQVERVWPLYERQCLECHGQNLDGGLIGGPPLKGSYFEQRWAGRSVAALFRYVQSRMPQDRPGSLSPQQTADLTALILSYNDQEPADAELEPDADELENFGIPD